MCRMTTTCFQAEEVKEIVSQEMAQKCGKMAFLPFSFTLVTSSELISPSFVFLFFFFNDKQRVFRVRPTYCASVCVCVSACVNVRVRPCVVGLPWQRHGTRVCRAICCVLSEEQAPRCRQRWSHSQTRDCH